MKKKVRKAAEASGALKKISAKKVWIIISTEEKDFTLVKLLIDSTKLNLM